MQNTPAAADEFTAQCACGKRYRVAAEKRGRKLKCHACGDVYLAEPAPPKERPTPAEGHPTKPRTSAEPPVDHGHEHAAAPVEQPPVEASSRPSVSRPPMAEPVDPSPLLKDISRGNLAMLVVVAVIAHIVVIGITSVGHISLCMKYGTFWPKPMMKKEREAEEKRKLEEKQAQQQKAVEEKQAADTAAQAAKKSEGGTKQASEETKNGRPKSKIERTIEEKSSERPKEGTVRLDEPGGLE
jgi:hypothetical protein